MKLLKAIFTVINFFVYFIGLFGSILSMVYDEWYFTVIFLGILLFVLIRYKSKMVLACSIGIAVTNYLSYYFLKQAPTVDGGLGGLAENVHCIVISGWIDIVTIISLICLIVAISHVKINLKSDVEVI